MRHCLALCTQPVGPCWKKKPRECIEAALRAASPHAYALADEAVRVLLPEEDEDGRVHFTQSALDGMDRDGQAEVLRTIFTRYFRTVVDSSNSTATASPGLSYHTSRPATAAPAQVWSQRRWRRRRLGWD